MLKSRSDWSNTQVTPNPELEKRTRRRFPAEYKLRIIAKADACKHGELGVILRYELQRGIPSANTSVLMFIKQTPESAGIEFTGDPLVNPGVTLRVKRDD